MAYVAGNLAQVSSVNGFGLYRYDTTDGITTVDTAGYFNNEDDTLELRAGDLIHVVSWTTAVRSGTISDVSLVVVTTVDSDRVVNVSTDIYEKGIYSSAD
jgi:hypothetical protein